MYHFVRSAWDVCNVTVNLVFADSNHGRIGTSRPHTSGPGIRYPQRENPHAPSPHPPGTARWLCRPQMIVPMHCHAGVPVECPQLRCQGCGPGPPPCQRSSRLPGGSPVPPGPSMALLIGGERHQYRYESSAVTRHAPSIPCGGWMGHVMACLWVPPLLVSDFGSETGNRLLSMRR